MKGGGKVKVQKKERVQTYRRIEAKEKARVKMQHQTMQKSKAKEILHAIH